MAPSDDAQSWDADRFSRIGAGEAFADFFDELPESVPARKNDVDHGRGDRQFAAAGRIEYAFQLVRQVFDGLQA